jgi:hypothetical protein
MNVVYVVYVAAQVVYVTEPVFVSDVLCRSEVLDKPRFFYGPLSTVSQFTSRYGPEAGRPCQNGGPSMPSQK